MALKSLLYLLTLGTAFFFAYRETKIKRQLTDGVLQSNANVSDFGVLNDLSRQMERERILKMLPRERLSRYRTVVVLKFIFVGLLIVEVLVLQR